MRGDHPRATPETHPTSIPQKMQACQSGQQSRQTMKPVTYSKIQGRANSERLRLTSQFCRHNGWDLVDTCKDHFRVKNKESTTLCTLPNGKNWQ